MFRQNQLSDEKKSDVYPDYYLRHVGESRIVYNPNDKLQRHYGIDVQLEVSLTNVGVLWALSKVVDGVPYFIKTGVPIVAVADHFKNQAHTNVRIQELKQKRQAFEDQLDQIDAELTALGAR